MKMLSFLLLLLHLSSGAVCTITMTGYTGGAVVIKCEYDVTYQQNTKYFCKDTSGLKTCNDLIKTNGLKDKWVDDGRFSLYDNTTGRFFLVIFRNLTAVDKGTYFCAVDIGGWPDSYRQVDLTIKEDECCMKTLNLSAYEGETVTLICKFPEEFKNMPKYFCKAFGRQECKYSLSTPEDQSWVGDEKLSLHDNREGVLTVSISSFSTSDAGSYWCGVDMGDYEALITHVQLTIRDWCCVNTIRITGLFEGDSVNFSCPYPQGYEDTEKFLCKGASRDNCVDQFTVKNSSVWLVNGTFSSLDNIVTRNVKVAIKGLRAGDFGPYWCGFDRKWKPSFNYTRVILSVGKHTLVTTVVNQAMILNISSSASSSSSSSYPSSTTAASSSLTATTKNALSTSDLVVPVSVSGAVLIIIIIIIIIILWRSKRKMTHVSESVGTSAVAETAAGMQLLSPEVDYEEIKDTRHPVHPDKPETVGTPAVGETAAGMQLLSPEVDYEEINPTSHPVDTDISLSVDNDLYAMAEIPTTPSDDPPFTGVQTCLPPTDSVAYATVSFHQSPDVSDASCSVITEVDDGLSDYARVKKPADLD